MPIPGLGGEMDKYIGNYNSLIRVTIWKFFSLKLGFGGLRKTEVAFKLRCKNEQVAKQLMGRESIPREGHKQKTWRQESMSHSGN